MSNFDTNNFFFPTSENVKENSKREKMSAFCGVFFVIVLLTLSWNGEQIEAKCLLREPPDIVVPPKQNDAGFYLEISGKPKFYEPGHLYTVSLRVMTSHFKLSHNELH